MAEQLNTLYNPAFFESLCPELKKNLSGFDSSYFIHRVFNNQWPDLVLTERVTHLARVLNDFLPQEFESACKIFVQVSDSFRSTGNNVHGLELIVCEWLVLFGGARATLSSLLSKTTSEFSVKPISSSSSRRFEFQLEHSNN